MRYRNWTSWILAVLVTPVFMACSQGAEEPSERLGQTLEPGPQPGRHAGRHGFMADPAKLVERLDKNKDGALDASELPGPKGEHLLGADANSDGKLTAAELTAHVAQKKHERFAAQDTNKDGFLSADEVGRRWARLGAADTDKDGRVSFDELQQAMSAGKLGFRPGHARHFGRRDPAGLLKRLDANGDGSVALSELPEHKRDKLGSADTNGDKLLSAEELRAFFSARRKAAVPNVPPNPGTTL